MRKVERKSDIVIEELKKVVETDNQRYQLPKDLRESIVFGLRAVKEVDGVFKYLSDEHKRDKNIIKSAVEQDSENLKYAFAHTKHHQCVSDKEYKEICETALEQDFRSFDYIDDTFFKNNSDIALIQLECAAKQINEIYPTITEKANRFAANYVHCIPYHMDDDMQIMWRRAGFDEKYFPLKTKAEYTVDLLNSNRMYYEDIDSDLLNNWKDAETILKSCPKAYAYISNSNILNDVTIAKKVVEADPSMYEYVSYTINDNKEICKIALQGDYELLAYMPPSIRENPEMIACSLESLNNNLENDIVRRNYSDKDKDEIFAKYYMSAVPVDLEDEVREILQNNGVLAKDEEEVDIEER